MTWLYALLRLINDVNAVANGRTGKRLARRALGRTSGRAIGKLTR